MRFPFLHTDSARKLEFLNLGIYPRTPVPIGQKSLEMAHEPRGVSFKL